MRSQYIDYSLYLVTDRKLAGNRALVDIVEPAIKGGVTIVQLREKGLAARDFIREAIELKGLLEPLCVPFIINDRVDIALAVDADGVHIGQRDMSLDIARRLLGPDKIIGVSVNNVEEAIEAQKNGADYLGVAPIWPTSTKEKTRPPLGLDGVAAIREAVEIPIVGIGGINEGNVASVITAGCDGVAVVSAIMAEKDPKLAAKKIIDKIKEAKSRQ
ncbi:thiamine phosphate synthase [bacterium]|nr:MAG: thiamine phosphate synthase [bacterium]